MCALIVFAVDVVPIYLFILQFASARPETLRALFTYLEHKHGSVDNFLDSLGLDGSWRAKLRQNLLRTTAAQ